MLGISYSYSYKQLKAIAMATLLKVIGWLYRFCTDGPAIVDIDIGDPGKISGLSMVIGPSSELELVEMCLHFEWCPTMVGSSLL